MYSMQMQLLNATGQRDTLINIVSKSCSGPAVSHCFAANLESLTSFCSFCVPDLQILTDLLAQVRLARRHEAQKSLMQERMGCQHLSVRMNSILVLGLLHKT